jgi:clan AA aspartic protease (TIGR02281 family)
MAIFRETPVRLALSGWGMLVMRTSGTIALTAVLLTAACAPSYPNGASAWVAPPPTPPSQWPWSVAHPLPAANPQPTPQVAARSTNRPEWELVRNGEGWEYRHNWSRPATNAQITQTAAPPANRVEVPLQRSQGGLFEVKVAINDVGSFRFEVDSGASAVTIPVNGFRQLIATGTIKRADYLGEAVSTLANGSRQINLMFRLASMSIAGRTVTNVRCLVVPDGSAFLLGQSFLGKFRSWSIDNSRNLLVLDS